VEQERLGAVRTLAEEAGGVVVWGMATKGVVLTTMVPEGLVVAGIDMNPGKQGRFAATSGVGIHAPELLSTTSATRVLIMNPNYLNEIRQSVAELGSSAQLICP
ncbi:MAG: class I SAM-dependent methyltransferase, partial [Acidimicrobiales bacterium]